MTKNIKYKQAKCMICGEFQILKDDICLECDGGDKFVNQLYKFLRNVKVKVLLEATQETLLQISQSYEKHGWIRLYSIQYGLYNQTKWCWRTVIAKENK